MNSPSAVAHCPNSNLPYGAIKNKRIVIWGNGRQALDFMYVFPQLQVEYFVATGEAAAKNLPKPVKSPVDLLSENKEDIFVIVCSSEADKARASMEGMFLQHNKHYAFSYEYAKLLDFPANSFGAKPVAVWCNNAGRVNEFTGYYGPANVSAVISDALQAEEISFPVSVKKPQELTPENYYIVILTQVKGGGKPVVQQLEARGLKRGADFCLWNNVTSTRDMLPSRMFYKTTHAEPMTVPFCDVPFYYFTAGNYYDPDGEVDAYTSICCPVWIKPEATGYLRDSTFSEVWDSPVARVFRLSMANHTFCFCNLGLCPIRCREYAKSQKQSPETIVREEDYAYKLKPHPKQVILCIHGTCNLHCLYCRPDQCTAQPAESQAINKIADKLMADPLPHVEELIMAGNGEVFFSSVYRRLLYDVNGRDRSRSSIQLLTNGQLFNEKNFLPLEKIYSRISVSMSIDGATRETYEKVRRGGKWETICKAMEYAGRLRKEGRLTCLQFQFIVTADSYQEMPAFIKWVKDLGADHVQFQRLHHCGGTQTKEEFERLSLYDGNDQIKPQYREFFKDPIFKDPIVIPDNVIPAS